MMDMLFSKPFVPPSTMLFTSARVGPDMASAKVESSFVATLINWPSWDSLTFGWTLTSRRPFGPLMLSKPSFSLTSTPLGTVTGYFAILDTVCNPVSVTSGNDDHPFPAQTGLARGAIGHDPVRGRYDGRTHAAQHLPQRVLATILAHPGGAETLD